jgi:hypothetical protein
MDSSPEMVEVSLPSSTSPSPAAAGNLFVASPIHAPSATTIDPEESSRCAAAHHANFFNNTF